MAAHSPGSPPHSAWSVWRSWSSSAATSRMTSSISTSDPPARAEETARPWRRWLAVFGGVYFGLGAVLFALLLLIDPYDTGRFPSFGFVGVADRSIRTADASRARD